MKRPQLAVAVLLAMLACGDEPASEPTTGMKILDRKATLDSLADAVRILVVFVGNSSDKGIYWLDPDDRRLHLAQKLEPGWSNRRSMMTWTGSHFVHGSKPDGFWSLAADGDHRQLTELGYVGQIAGDGERILRFRKCGSDGRGFGYAITPLGQLLDHAVCAPRQLPGDPEAWYYLRPVWNPHLPRADYLLSRRIGKGREMVVKWTRLMALEEGGELSELFDLGGMFSEWLENDVQPRPDGEAFYLYDAERGGRVVDRRGEPLADLAALSAGLPDLRLERRFSWSPDGLEAALFFEDCREDGETCRQVLALASDDFSKLEELTTLPAGYRFNHVIWSPDGRHLALVTDIHQGAEDPPRILTIDLADRSTDELIFPARFILVKAQWVR